MQLSPTVRWLLTGVAAGVTAFGGLIASGVLLDLPSWVGVLVAVLGAVFSGLGLVPPQVGGTQQGVVNPSVSEPPAADVQKFHRTDQTGFSEGAIAFWPVAALPFAADRVSEGEALFWIGVLVVVGCLVAAAVAAFKYAQYVGAAVLVLIAIVAAFLLL
jgi:hypothetical protein